MDEGTKGERAIKLPCKKERQRAGYDIALKLPRKKEAAEYRRGLDKKRDGISHNGRNRSRITSGVTDIERL